MQPKRRCAMTSIFDMLAAFFARREVDSSVVGGWFLAVTGHLQWALGQTL
jgi:hypothetical protein